MAFLTASFVYQIEHVFMFNHLVGGGKKLELCNWDRSDRFDIAAKGSGRALNPDLGWIMLNMIGRISELHIPILIRESALLLVGCAGIMFKRAPARVFI